MSRLLRLTVILAAFVSLSGHTPTSEPARDGCNLVCEELCAQDNDGLSNACACDWGAGSECGCICSSYPGSHDCDDFPGCRMDMADASCQQGAVGVQPLGTAVVPWRAGRTERGE